MSASETSPVENWYRGFIQGKTRIAIAWIFAFVLIFSARQYPNLPGIAICFVGATIRFWASGYLRKDDKPAVGGPYALSRNPLYLGTWLMAIGAAVSVANWWLSAAATVVFALVYHWIILLEEEKLHRIFGRSYALYQQAVPRFFPRFWPPRRETLLEINPEASHLKFSWPLAGKNKAWEPHLTFVALIGMIALIAWAWQTYGSNLPF